MIKYLSFALLCLNSICTSAQSLSLYEVNTFDTYQRVLAMAQENDQLMVCIIYEDNGKLENMVRQGVFRDSSVRQQYSAILPMAIKLNTEMGGRLADDIGILSLPTIAYFSADELLLHLLEGEQSASQLVTGLAVAHEKADRFKKLGKLYQQGELDSDNWRELIDIYEMNFSFEETQRLVFQYLQSLSKDQWWTQPNQALLLAYGLDLEGPYAVEILANREQIEEERWQQYYEQAFDYNFDRALINGDTVLLEKMITELIPPASNDSLTAKLQFETARRFAREQENFSYWKRASLRYAETISDSSKRYEQLYDEAFLLAEEYNQEEALRAARQLAQAAADVQETFKVYMLDAYLAYLLQNYEEALITSKKAAGLAEGKTQENQAERLQLMIEAEQAETP